jgi:uncharacterized protein
VTTLRISLPSLRNRRNHNLHLTETLVMEDICQEVAHLTGLAPVHVQAEVTQTRDQLYRVGIKHAAQATLVCSRCLQTFPHLLAGEWEVRFTTEASVAETLDGSEIQQLDAEYLDLIPLAREALLLQIPYAPVCGEDCLGLCPVCGADRNQQACSCDRVTVDPRWAKLLDLPEEES